MATQLSQEELHTIAAWVLEEVRKQTIPESPNRTDEILTRMLHVEEELRLQRELMDQRFTDAKERTEALQREMDRRFAETLHYMDKRFEQVDKRFEQVDKRFEQVDRRFEELGRRFSGLVALISTISVIIGGMIVLFQVL